MGAARSHTWWAAGALRMGHEGHAAEYLARQLLTSCAQVGGTPAVMKYLLQKGLLDGSCLTVTGAHILRLHALASRLLLDHGHCPEACFIASLPSSYTYR